MEIDVACQDSVVTDEMWHAAHREKSSKEFLSKLALTFPLTLALQRRCISLVAFCAYPRPQLKLTLPDHL
ncbi:hypothetical protein P4S72_03130 [Vibrio sp. PP-XX7]